MAISAALQAIYSSEVDLTYWSGVVLSHPSATTVYLTDAPEAQVGLVSGVARTFTAVPFALVVPSRDAEGRQDLRVQVCAVGPGVAGLLDQAIADPTTPITLAYGQWLYGDTTQQWDPLLELALTDIVLTQDGIGATATAADVLNKPVPAQRYRIDTYPGLDRR
jgi:hypothetical protein